MNATSAKGQARFRRTSRLVKTDDFSSVFYFGCKTSSNHLSVYAKPAASEQARIGITVSKKTAPSSVTRNYARRIVREAFRRHADAFAGLDLVVRVQKPFPAKALALIESELLGQVAALREKVARGGRGGGRSANKEQHAGPID
ncbi:MAG: ribonuclease P protein component [Burkholderiales bacterium]